MELKCIVEFLIITTPLFYIHRISIKTVKYEQERMYSYHIIHSNWFNEICKPLVVHKPSLLLSFIDRT